MPDTPPPDYLPDAADRKANGQSWESIARFLDLDPDDLRKLPRAHPAAWRAEYQFGRRQVALDAQAEAIGEDLRVREHLEIQRAMRLDLPAVEGEPIPILYVEIDGTGIPVVKKETAGRKGKIDGQPAHTREAKLGCVFTQTGWDEQGFALRDPASTTYTGAIETADEFGQRLYLEAWNRGWSRAHKKVVVGDGAAWIWNLAAQYFPGAIEIVDLFHARQHLWELARQLHPHDPRAQQRWIARHQKGWLDQGKIEPLVASLRATISPHPEVAEKLRTEADYFETHAARMHYPQFRKQHLFVGSGVIEAGCKTVIGSRLKPLGGVPGTAPCATMDRSPSLASIDVWRDLSSLEISIRVSTKRA